MAWLVFCFGLELQAWFCPNFSEMTPVLYQLCFLVYVKYQSIFVFFYPYSRYQCNYPLISISVYPCILVSEYLSRQAYNQIGYMKVYVHKDTDADLHMNTYMFLYMISWIRNSIYTELGNLRVKNDTNIQGRGLRSIVTKENDSQFFYICFIYKG